MTKHKTFLMQEQPNSSQIKKNINIYAVLLKMDEAGQQRFD